MRVITGWANRQWLAGPKRQHGSAEVPEVRSPSDRPARPTPYLARRVARMLTAEVATVAEQYRVYVERLLALSPTLAAFRALAQGFAAMVRAHAADVLVPWLAEAESRELHGFAAVLRQDESAVRAALTLPWSGSQVERTGYPPEAGQAPGLRAGEARSAQDAPGQCRMTKTFTEATDEFLLHAYRQKA